MSKMTANPVSRKSDLVTQEHEKEILIYDLIIDKAFSLNETSSLIWNLCNGKNSVSEIAESLSRKLNSSVGEDFVWLALEQLKKDNLLENGDKISIDFGGLSRREVIRKVGFATFAALPLIASLTAPAAVNAASSCFGDNNNRQSADGCSCNSASDCIGNCCADSPNARVCISTNRAQGAACGVNCECSLDCCVNNVCANRTVAQGGACTRSCQCATTALTCQSSQCCPAGGCPIP